MPAGLCCSCTYDMVDGASFSSNRGVCSRSQLPGGGWGCHTRLATEIGQVALACLDRVSRAPDFPSPLLLATRERYIQFAAVLQQSGQEHRFGEDSRLTLLSKTSQQPIPGPALG